MRNHRRLIIPIAALLAAAAFITFIRSQYVLPVLMYHSVSPGEPLTNRMNVLPETFERQMRFLHDRGYHFLALADLDDYIAGRKKIPPRPVIITFDDGYRDNYTYALPVLKKYAIPATIFIIADAIGQPDKLTWEQIKEMQDSGLISFGSHTKSHPLLTSLGSSEQLRTEIAGSKKFFEERLGRSVETFCYPIGSFNETVRQAVRDAGYTVGVVTSPGKACPRNDVFTFKRLRISESTGNLLFFWFKTLGFYHLVQENRHK